LDLDSDDDEERSGFFGAVSASGTDFYDPLTGGVLETDLPGFDGGNQGQRSTNSNE
jgi:hypothetical protein